MMKRRGALVAQSADMHCEMEQVAVKPGEEEERVAVIQDEIAVTPSIDAQSKMEDTEWSR